MKKLVAIRDFLTSPSYAGDLMGGESWAAWRTLLIATMGEPLEPDELPIFQELTGRSTAPSEPVREFFAICGRRAGKSRAVAALGAYTATCIDYRHILAPGEWGELAIIAQNTSKAQKINDYIRGIFSSVPYLGNLVESVKSDTLRLSSHVEISVSAASFRNLRGGTLVCTIADELAFWPSDEGSRNPDSEILAAIRPSMLTTKGQLIGISSPYARRGVLYNVFCKHFGAGGSPRILVAKASSERMNSTIDPADIAAAYEDDPVAAASEFGGEFRSDVESFVGLETVLAAVDKGVYEREPRHGVTYRAFADPSGGHQDSYTLAIGHSAGDKLVLDLLREVRPPMSPEAVTAEFADDLRRYGLRKVTADRWGASWVEERFACEGIKADQSADPKSVIYGNFLPLLNSGRVRLLDNVRLVAQLVGLERRTARGGRDSIDHAPGGHDDLVNAAAGVLCLATTKAPSCFWAPIRGAF
jgi:hypothetical protein